MKPLKDSLKSEVSAKLKRLKEEFRKWYGLLSIKELTVNRDLISEIEVLERMFARKGVLNGK